MQGSSIHRNHKKKKALELIRFGEFLRERNAISDEQLLCALADHWSNGGRIGAAIARLGLLDEEEIERHAAAYHQLDVVEVGGRPRA